jgi:hypothetical protein
MTRTKVPIQSYSSAPVLRDGALSSVVAAVSKSVVILLLLLLLLPLVLHHQPAMLEHHIEQLRHLSLSVTTHTM